MKRLPIKAIYAIKDPETNLIRYIGGSIDGYRRYHEHFTPSRLGRFKNPEFRDWIIKIRANKPEMVILENIPEDKSLEYLREREWYWTNEYRKNGAQLFNEFIGNKHSERTKKLVSLSNSRRRMSEKSKAKMTITKTKYIFILDGEKIYGLTNLSKKIHIPTSTIHYKIKHNMEIYKGCTIHG